METYTKVLGFPGGASGKETACQCKLDVRDEGLIPGSGRTPGGGLSHPFQYSCLENPMDRGAWRAIVHQVTQSDKAEVTWHACTHTKVTGGVLYQGHLQN